MIFVHYLNSAILIFRVRAERTLVIWDCIYLLQKTIFFESVRTEGQNLFSCLVLM